MRAPTLIFDIETMTDLKAGAKLHHLDLPSDSVEQALSKLRRQETGHDFQRLSLHEIVCISGLWVDEHGLRLFSFTQEQDTEAQILTRFLAIFDKYEPNLVSWNGSQFDLPVILFRAMYHGLSATGLFDQGEHAGQKRFNNYQNRYHQRHTDLMDVMAMFNGRNFQKLDEVAYILGFPGKIGQTGYQVTAQVNAGQWSELSRYCEGDVLNTWLIYLRWLLLKGQLNPNSYDQWIQSTINYLEPLPEQHEFLQAWQQSAQMNDFAAHAFSARH